MTEEQLFNSIRLERNPHALLLSGPVGAGKRELARRLAALYCTGEPDIARLRNEPNYLEFGEQPILMEAVRTLTASARMTGFNGGRRAYVLIDAHRMSPQVQNALLKTIEEPPRDALFVLTGSEAGVLSTIRSRCAVVRIGAGAEEDIKAGLVNAGVPGERAALAASLAGGVPGLAARYAADGYLAFRAEAVELLKTLLFGVPPLLELPKLLSSDQGGEEKRAQIDNASDILTVWESLLADALRLSSGETAIRNFDYQALAGRIRQSFTIGAIQGMIDKVLEAETKLFYRPNAAFLMDAAAIGVAECKEKIG